MTAPRVGLVGARRVRQGLGPFVARDLLAAGAGIAGFVAGSEAGLAAGQRLLAGLGIEARGYRSVAALVAAEAPDAIAVLSPSDTHEGHLWDALDVGVDALCDKPLVWGGPRLAARAAALVDSFAAADRLLRVNCQWPHTLTTFEQLHPGALAAPPGHFEMWLQPAAAGVQGLADSLPHPLSLLQALVPGTPGSERLEEPHFGDAGGPAQAGRLRVGFRYVTDAHAVSVAVHLAPTDRGRRAAAYAVDGRRARRVIRGEAYRLSFADDAGREVPLPDPMTRVIQDFVAVLRDGDAAARAPDPTIAPRMALLEQLVAAFPEPQR